MQEAQAAHVHFVIVSLNLAAYINLRDLQGLGVLFGQKKCNVAMSPVRRHTLQLRVSRHYQTRVHIYDYYVLHLTIAFNYPWFVPEPRFSETLYGVAMVDSLRSTVLFHQ